MPIVCHLFSKSNDGGGRNSFVCVWHSFHAVILASFIPDLSSHNWQVPWTASEIVTNSFKRLHCCKIGGQPLFAQHLIQGGIMHLVFVGRGPGSLVGACRLRTAAHLQRRQTANTSVHLISQSSAAAFIPLAHLLLFLWSEEKEPQINGRSFRMLKHLHGPSAPSFYF